MLVEALNVASKFLKTEKAGMKMKCISPLKLRRCIKQPDEASLCRQTALCVLKSIINLCIKHEITGVIFAPVNIDKPEIINHIRFSLDFQGIF